jgi:MarR family transcriptional regulator, 2-MHQ and catechol-resistance regulon repressor
LGKTPKQHQLVEVNIKENIPRVFILFLQTAHAVEKYCDKELYFKERLSMPQLAVLQILNDNGGTMMPSAIAMLMLVEKHNITVLVDRMSRDGLVMVERGLCSDRRKVNVILTDEGRRVLKKALPVNEKIIKRIMANIDEDTAISLEKNLKILRLNASKELHLISKS